jgi:hypothetical protein
MKKYQFFSIILILVFTLGHISCARKVGCPSNGKNVGAERLLSGEKVPKARKFKS